MAYFYKFDAKLVRCRKEQKPKCFTKGEVVHNTLFFFQMQIAAKRGRKKQALWIATNIEKIVCTIYLFKNILYNLASVRQSWYT